MLSVGCRLRSGELIASLAALSAVRTVRTGDEDGQRSVSECSVDFGDRPATLTQQGSPVRQIWADERYVGG
jgi:hypothetical protein